MGPSGSGKTTLLNALSGQLRKSKGLHLEGTVHRNAVAAVDHHAEVILRLGVPLVCSEPGQPHRLRQPLHVRSRRHPPVAAPLLPVGRARICLAGRAAAYFPASGSASSAFTPLGIWPMSSSAVRVALKVTVPLLPRSVVMTMSPIAR